MKRTTEKDKIRCTHCGSEKYVKNGTYKGVQRYRCKSCGAAFSDTVRKFTYEDKNKSIELYLNNVGIRKIAKFIGCSHPMVIRWIRQFRDNLRRQAGEVKEELEKQIPDVIEMDEIYTRIKKGAIEFPYGLLILGGEAKLLHMSSEQKKNAP